MICHGCDMGDRRPAMQSLASKYRLICITMGSIELTDPQDIDTEQLEYCGNWTTDGHWLLLPASQALVATVDITSAPSQRGFMHRSAMPSRRNPENCRGSSQWPKTLRSWRRIIPSAHGLSDRLFHL